jgi:predicted NBD/HSP70 family sugar kinase
MPRPAGSAKLLRAINSSATLSHLLSNGRLTRAELRDLTGLSKPTSSEMLRLLTHAGLAVVTGRTAGGLGPTAEIYAPNPDAAYVVAISVRDTSGEDRPDLAYAIADLAGDVRHRHEEWVDFGRLDPAAAVGRAVEAACAGAGLDPARVRRVQIGVAGSYDRRTDTVHQIDVPGWRRSGITAAIAGRLSEDGLDSGVVVAVENDVNLAANAERHHGVAAGAESFAMLWLDHGLGLAMDLGGRLLRGARGSAGEIGYLPLYAGLGEAGPADLQDLLGGPAVVDLAREHGSEARTPAVAVAAALGSAGFVAELSRRIAYALTTVVAVLDPPLVVLSGAVARAGGAHLRDAVVVALAAMTPAPHATRPAIGDVEIAVTEVDDDAVLLGGLDAGQQAVRESLISSLAEPVPR